MKLVKILSFSSAATLLVGVATVLTPTTPTKTTTTTPTTSTKTTTTTPTTPTKTTTTTPTTPTKVPTPVATPTPTPAPKPTTGTQTTGSLPSFLFLSKFNDPCPPNNSVSTSGNIKTLQQVSGNNASVTADFSGVQGIDSKTGAVFHTTSSFKQVGAVGTQATYPETLLFTGPAGHKTVTINFKVPLKFTAVGATIAGSPEIGSGTCNPQ